MTVPSQHQAVVKMDVTAGASATTDISAGLLSAVLNMSKNIGVHHTLGSYWQQATEGGILSDLNLTARVETGTTVAYHYLRAWLMTTPAGERTFEVYTPDALSGSISYTFEGAGAGGNNLVQGTGGSGDVQSAAFNIKPSGTIAYAAVV